MQMKKILILLCVLLSILSITVIAPGMGGGGKTQAQCDAAYTPQSSCINHLYQRYTPAGAACVVWKTYNFSVYSNYTAFYGVKANISNYQSKTVNLSTRTQSCGNVFVNVKGSCTGNTAETVPYTITCPTPPATKPTKINATGISIIQETETVQPDRKNYQITCNGTGSLYIDMDGYATNGYSVFHNNLFVEKSYDTIYEIKQCSTWSFVSIFKPIDDCASTKTIIYASLTLLSIVIIVFAARSLLNQDQIELTTVINIIAIAIAIILGYLIAGSVAFTLCGV